MAITATVLLTVKCQQHQELADERRGARQRQGGQTGEEEHAGQHRQQLAGAAEVGDQRRAAAGHEHAHDEEQQAGRQAVVDHVEHRAGARLRGEREDADADEAEVGDRGVRHQPLQVVLADREQRGVDDADQRQRDRQRREVADASGNSGRQ